MPIAGPHNTGTATMTIEEPIKGLPVIDEWIDQDKAAWQRDSPLSHALLPAVLAAFVLAPFGMECLEPPEAFDNPPHAAFAHQESFAKAF